MGVAHEIRAEITKISASDLVYAKSWAEGIEATVPMLISILFTLKRQLRIVITFAI